MYDYIEYLKKFGFEWIQNDLGLKYRIKINNSDSKKKNKKNPAYFKQINEKKNLFRWVENLERENDMEKKWICSR